MESHPSRLSTSGLGPARGAAGVCIRPVCSHCCSGRHWLTQMGSLSPSRPAHRPRTGSPARSCLPQWSRAASLADLPVVLLRGFPRTAVLGVENTFLLFLELIFPFLIFVFQGSDRFLELFYSPLSRRPRSPPPIPVTVAGRETGAEWVAWRRPLAAVAVPPFPSRPSPTALGDRMQAVWGDKWTPAPTGPHRASHAHLCVVCLAVCPALPFYLPRGPAPSRRKLRFPGCMCWGSPRRTRSCAHPTPGPLLPAGNAIH